MLTGVVPRYGEFEEWLSALHELPMPVTFPPFHYLTVLQDAIVDGQPMEPRIQVMVIVLAISLFGKQSRPIRAVPLSTFLALGIAVSFPGVSKSIPFLRIPHIVFFIGKHFGTGNSSSLPALIVESLTFPFSSPKVSSSLLHLFISYKTRSKLCKSVKLKSTLTTSENTLVSLCISLHRPLAPS